MKETTLLIKELIGDFSQPAILVINREWQIYYCSTNISSYIDHSNVEFELNALLIRSNPKLVAAVKAAILSIKNNLELKIIKGFKLGNHKQLFSLQIQKLETEISNNSFYKLTISPESKKDFNKKQLTSSGVNAALNKKLNETEELVRKKNAELESLKVKYQSLVEKNEDNLSTLNHLNTEYEININELLETNNYINDLLKSTNIATLFLNSKLEIVKYTPLIENLFNIEKQDVNRPVKNFTNKLQGQGWLHEAEDAIKKNTTKQAEVITKNGKFFLMLIAPFTFKKAKTNGVSISFVDISNLKNTQLKLGKSESVFQSIFENSYQGIATINSKTKKIETANKKMLKIFGEKNVSGFIKNFPEKYLPKYQANGELSTKWRKKTRISLNTKRYINQEINFLKADRTPFTAEVNVSFLDDHSNTKVLILKDVTVERETKKALEKSERLYQSLFENALTGILIADFKTQKFTYANETIIKMLGYSREELFKLTPKDITAEENIKALKSSTKKLASKKQKEVHTEKKYKKKDGSIIYAYSSIRLIKVGKDTIGFCASVLDISNQKNAIDAKLEAEAQYKALFASAPFGVGIFDLDKVKLIDINEKHQELTGLSKSELLKTAPHEVLADIQEDGRPVEAHVKEMLVELAKKGKTERNLFHIHKKKGQFRTKVSLFTLPSLNGNLAVSIVQDIDSEYEATKALELSSQQLKESEEKYKNLFEYAADGLVLFDIEKQTVLDVNTKLSKMSGFSKAELIEKGLLGMLTEYLENGKSTATQYFKMIAELSAKNISKGDFIHLHKKKQAFYVRISTYKLPKYSPNLVIVSIKDIDAQVKAEKAAALNLQKLIASESRHRAFFNLSLDGHAILNLKDGKQVEANDRLLKMLRISRKTFFNTPSSEFQDSEKNNMPEFGYLKEIYASFKNNQHYDAELFFKSKKRSSFLGKMFAAKLPPPNDQLAYIIIKDIDKEHKLKLAADKQVEILTNSESKFRTLFENGQDGFFIVDINDFNIIDFNAKACKLLGYTGTEMRHISLFSFLPEKQSDGRTRSQIVKMILEKLKKQGNYSIDSEHNHKKNGIFKATTTFVMLKKPNDHLVFVQLTDKDKEFKALQQVKQSEAIFKGVFANALHGIVIYEVATLKAIDCNSQLLKMAGCSKYDFMQATFTDFEPANKKGDKIEKSMFAKHLNKNKKGSKAEWTFTKYKSNELIYTIVSTTLLPKPLSHLGTVSILDITERKLAENAIVEKNRAIESSQLALQHNEEKFRATFNNSNNFIGRISFEGYLIEHNQTVSNNVFDRSNPTTGIFVWEFPWFKGQKEGQKTLKSDLKKAKTGKTVTSQINYSVSLNFTGILEYTFTPIFKEGKIDWILAEGRDVTAQVNTLKRLALNEQKFSALYQKSKNFMGIFSIRGVILELNEMVTKNLLENEVETIGIHLWEFPWFAEHKNTQQKFREAFKLAAKGVASNGIANYSIYKDHNGVMQYSVVPIFDENNKVAWVMGEGTDLTEITNAQRALAVKEQKFRAIFNNSSNYIGLYDTNGVIEELNKTTLKQISKKEITTKQTYIWDVPWFNKYKENKLIFKESIHEALKGIVVKRKINFSPDGNYRGIFDFTLSPIIDKAGKVIKILSEARDVTDLINTQKIIEQREKIFKATFYNAFNHIVRLSPDGKVLEHNGIDEKKEHYNRVKKYLGKYLWEFSGVFSNEESQKKLKHDIKKAAGGQFATNRISSIERNEPVELKYTFTPVFDDDNNVEWILGEAIDITNILKTQQQLAINEQKFRATFYNSSNFIARLNLQGNVLEFNKIMSGDENYEDVKHYIGKPLWEFSGILDFKKSVSQLKRDIKKCAAGNFVSSQMEMFVNKIENLNGNGSNEASYNTGLVTYTLSPIFDKKGKVDWILAEAKDITALNLAQNKLRESSNKYYGLFNNNLVGIAVLDKDFVFTESNKAFEKISGYKHEEINEIGFINLVIPEERQMIRYNIQRLLSQKINTFKNKRHFLKKDGTAYTVILHTKPEYQNGKFAGCLITLSDVSELENSRKRLKESEELYKGVFEGVNDGLFVFNNIKNVMVTFNKRLMEIVGAKSKKNFIKDVTTKCIPYLESSEKLNTNWLNEINAEFQKNKIAKFEWKSRKLNGQPLEATTTTIKLSNSLSLTVVKDVTETKKAQKALKDSEIKYRSLFENNFSGLFLGNKFGNILQANDALCKMFGYTQKEMLKLNHKDLSVMGADDKSYLHFKAMVEGKVKKFSTTKQFIKKNGETFFAIIYVNGVYNEKGEFVFNVASISDVTELKQLESDLKDNQAQLAEKIIELEEYIKSNLELENFAFLASHDLRSPVQTVINFSSLLKTKLSNKLQSEEQMYLDFILDGSKRMHDTINDLLDFSLANNNNLKIEQVNINTVLKTVLNDISSSIVEKKATISIGKLPKVILVDQGLVRQLFQNLISNAIKFTSKNKKPLVEIKHKETNKEHIFSVKDNGIGIPKRLQHKIFGIFKRLHNQNEYEGTGIGLALCKKVVERHNGKIWLESAAKRGATFFISLPKN